MSILSALTNPITPMTSPTPYTGPNQPNEGITNLGLFLGMGVMTVAGVPLVIYGAYKLVQWCTTKEEPEHIYEEL